MSFLPYWTLFWPFHLLVRSNPQQWHHDRDSGLSIYQRLDCTPWSSFYHYRTTDCRCQFESALWQYSWCSSCEQSASAPHHTIPLPTSPLKASLKSFNQPTNWTDSLSMVLLSICTARKDDIHYMHLIVSARWILWPHQRRCRSRPCQLHHLSEVWSSSRLPLFGNRLREI